MGNENDLKNQQKSSKNNKIKAEEKTKDVSQKSGGNYNELQIEKNLRQQEILSRISLNFNSLDRFSQKINDALQIIGEHTDVSRVYIFEDSEDNQSTSNTYEWCNVGVSPHINELQNLSYGTIPSWKRLLKENGLIHSENIRNLPEDIYSILAPQKIKSIISFPLTNSENIFGFIGFDECSTKRCWVKSEIQLIQTVANIISNAFVKQKIQAELANRERENRIILQSMPDIILQVDKKGRIKSFNSPVKNKLFEKVKNDNSDTIHSVFDKKLANLFTDAIEECFRNERYRFDFKHVGLNDIEQYEARLVKLNENDALIIIRDLTEIRENEKQLKIAKEKAEEASQSKSEFLANVSHEIRTPLNAILGFSQWLHDNTNIQQHREYIGTILSSGRKLLSLMNDILDLSKIESGKMDVEMLPMHYHEVINDIKMVFKKDVEEKGISFKITTEPAVPDYIYMDELRFYQVIFNLVSNAVKFTSNGYVQVAASATKTKTENEINLIITVEDTGVGIKANKQKEIFNSFTQQSGESDRDFEGTGLGLAIVNGLLSKLNGTINLKSKPGKGSVFTITLFNVKVDTSEHPKKEVEQEERQMILAPCTIMIVDDIDYNILVLKKLIGTDTVDFIEAKDGTEALAKLKDHKPDLIFMDIRMPGLSGFDITEMIRKDPKHQGTPIVAFTASTLKQQNEKINLMFDSYLQKPIFKKDVETVLKKFLSFSYINKANGKETAENEKVISVDCREDLPEIITELKLNFQNKWLGIKDSLVIYEIEEFNKQLEEFAFQKSFKPLLQYCAELDTGLKSFDIDLIEQKLSEFPSLIEKLESYKKSE